MKKILINSLGNSFESIEQKSVNSKEIQFIWKHNFKIKRKLKLKNLKKTFKINSLRSEKSKNEFLLWKQMDKNFYKKTFKEIELIEKKLIKNSLLDFEVLLDDIKIKIHNKEIALKYFELFEMQEKIFNYISSSRVEKANNFKMLKSTNILIKFFNKPIKIAKNIKQKKQYNSEILEVQKTFLDKVNKINSLLEQTKNKEKNIKIFNAKNINKELRGIVSKNKLDNKKNASKKNRIILDNKNLNWIEKNILSTFLNSYRVNKNEKMLKTLEENEKYSYNIKLKKLNALTYIDFENQIIDKKQEKAKILDRLKSEYKLSKKNKKEFSKQKKEYKKELSSKLQNLKKNFKKHYIQLKSNSVSRRAKWIEFKKYKNEKSNIKRSLKKIISKNKNRSKIWETRNESRLEIKFLKKIRELDLKNNILSTPIEITSTKYWSSIILGSLIPGFGSLIHKQFMKSLIHLSFTILSITTLLWIFGLFPSYAGNGLVGLKSLGYDSATAAGIDIGVTNGKPNDGRFYLVTGGLGIIFLILIFVFWAMSIMSNINNNNLIRLGVRQTNWKQQKKLLKNNGLPYLLSIPAMIFILFIVLLPIIATLLISFTNINERFWVEDIKRFKIADGITNKISWIGIKQYKEIFTVLGPEFKGVMSWTLIWTFFATAIVIFLGTFFAVLANQNRIKGKTFFRVIYLLPWAVPGFITIMFFSIFFENTGIFNKIIGDKIFTPKTDWQNAGNKTKALMIFLQGWLGHSYMFLLITGMLQSIPKSLYEAAKIDGSSNMNQFRTITAPIIISKIAPLLIGQFTFNFNNFGLIYLFNEGGPVHSGKTSGEFDIFISWIYKLINTGSNSSPGAAAAISLIISIFTVTPSAYLFLRSKSFRKGDF